MRTFSTAFLFTLSFAAAASASILDDFNDGNDTGWTRQTPLTPFGAPAAFSFPAGAYQISAPASPDPVNFGPGRGGSVRTDEAYTNFFQQVDIVDWDETKTSMAMGFLARGRQFALGQTDAYVLVLGANGDFYITTTLNEAPQSPNLAQDFTFNLDPNADYRLTFSGFGNSLSAQLYNLADLSAPVSTLNAVDTASTYTSGNSGVFIYDGSGANSSSATFDNYFSAPEPASIAILAAGGMVLAARRRRVS